MEKIWLKNYAPGVPAEIDANAYHSIIDIFQQSCKKYADKPAFQNFDHTITYAKLAELSRHFTAYLQQVLHLKKGDRLAIMLPNVLQYPVVLFGALSAGLIVVNVNPLYTPRELIHQLHDSGATAIVVLENFAHTLQKALPETQIEHVITTKLGDLLPFPRSFITNFFIKYIKKMVPTWEIPHAITLKHALAAGKPLPCEPATLAHDDIAFLQYTGGTTGIAKGAVLTHGNLVANIQQCSAWFNAILREGKEIIITALPLYHIFSLTGNCLVFLKYGALNVLITNPRDIPTFVNQLARIPFTAITGVNTLFNALLNNAKFATLDFSHLRIALSGGVMTQKHVAERWQTLTGQTMRVGYGLTETSPTVTVTPLNLTAFNDSIGLPLPSTDVSIRDDHHQEVPLGSPGELCVKGPQVMQRYWHNPKETDIAFTPDGWFKTGDIVTMDAEGYLRIVDRKKDMIDVSGFNVYPNEVEGVIASYPGVLEVAVIGVPDARTTEAVKAIVVKKDPALTADDIIHYCHQELTPYKVPTSIEFRSELPKSNVGKILRRVLREEVSSP